MNYTFKLARRMARLRAVAFLAGMLAMGACDTANQLGPISLDEGTVTADSTPPTNATGVVFGAFDLPNDQFGSSLTGSVRAVGPDNVLPILAAARKAGARVVVRLSASAQYWTNDDHSVNLDKWKSQVARFKDVDIQPYIADGTLLAHYMIDEPHDASNWGGEPVPYETLEAMAKYSKQLWPGLTTVVRAYPDWLAKAAFRWTYLDAAWAQYSARKGEVNSWMSTQASYAKQEGLGLIVGLNWLDGGTSASGIAGNQSGAYAMSASQIRTFGTALVSNPYACAMYNWRYSPTYFERSDIKAAIEYVAAQAKTRSRISCTGSGQVLSSINSSAIVLKVTGWVQAGRQYMSLDWSGAKGTSVDVYRVGARMTSTANDGHFVNSLIARAGATYVYKVCQMGTTAVCSSSVSVAFR